MFLYIIAIFNKKRKTYKLNELPCLSSLSIKIQDLFPLYLDSSDFSTVS